MTRRGGKGRGVIVVVGKGGGVWVGSAGRVGLAGAADVALEAAVAEAGGAAAITGSSVGAGIGLVKSAGKAAGREGAPAWFPGENHLRAKKLPPARARSRTPITTPMILWPPFLAAGAAVLGTGGSPLPPGALTCADQAAGTALLGTGSMTVACRPAIGPASNWVACGSIPEITSITVASGGGSVLGSGGGLSR
jgi:hypothetical protein